MPSLDVVKVFGLLLSVTNDHSEFNRFSNERVKGFVKLKDNSEWRVHFCADDCTIVFPLRIGWVLAAWIGKLLDIVSHSLEIDVNAIFMVHFEGAALCDLGGKW